MLSFVGDNGVVTTTSKTARQRAREQITDEILRAARDRLTRTGPGELSLRAVARDVGMVSSAVYRYFPSRDDLLTALLIEGYDELGAAVEQADRDVADHADVAARWLSACRTVRTWSLAHPGDYALLYGSPVPGYAAPQDTIGPATRVVVVLIGIINDAYAAGADAPATSTTPELDELVAGAVEFAQQQGFEELPADLVVRTIMAWTTIFGTVSFELFGHLHGSISDYATYFDEVCGRLGASVGLASGL